MTQNETIQSAIDLLAADSEDGGVIEYNELRKFCWTRHRIDPVSVGKYLAVQQSKKKIESVIIGVDVYIVLKS